MMVNNSTNINETNNHFLPEIIENEKKSMTYDIGNPCPGLGQAQKCGRVTLVNGMCIYFLNYS